MIAAWLRQKKRGLSESERTERRQLLSHRENVSEMSKSQGKESG